MKLNSKSPVLMHGVYSKTAAETNGSFLWKNLDGTEVEVTAVYDPNNFVENPYHQPDMLVVSTQAISFVKRLSWGNQRWFVGQHPQL